MTNSIDYWLKVVMVSSIVMFWVYISYLCLSEGWQMIKGQRNATYTLLGIFSVYIGVVLLIHYSGVVNDYD